MPYAAFIVLRDAARAAAKAQGITLDQGQAGYRVGLFGVRIPADLGGLPRGWLPRTDSAAGNGWYGVWNDMG